MASSQDTSSEVEQTQNNPEVNNNVSASGIVDEEVIQTAKSELQRKMAEVVENPPSEQPPPPSSTAVDEMNYMEPAPDPYSKAITYLEQHNILQIFQNMTANIIYKKPDNPVDFMMTEIAEMKRVRDSTAQKK